MTATSFWQTLSAIVPLIGMAVAIVAAVIYIRYRGNLDAKNETITTYERLAEGRKEEAEELRREVKALEEKVSGLELELHAQGIAFEKLMNKFLEISRYGTCVYSDTCADFRQPSKEHL